MHVTNINMQVQLLDIYLQKFYFICLQNANNFLDSRLRRMLIYLYKQRKIEYNFLDLHEHTGYDKNL